jgi:hypothetical protein
MSCVRRLLKLKRSCWRPTKLVALFLKSASSSVQWLLEVRNKMGCFAPLTLAFFNFRFRAILFDRRDVVGQRHVPNFFSAIYGTFHEGYDSKISLLIITIV